MMLLGKAHTELNRAIRSWVGEEEKAWGSSIQQIDTYQMKMDS